jgi:dihydrofolate synthase/folylpolyglutamate synthase
MEFEPEYQQLLDYLYSFVDFSLQKNLQFDPDRFNLQRIRAFAELLGNPHLSYPVIHVAGSKGKGSVSALCASALKTGGYRTGLYISPHLNDYNERIQINGSPISHGELIRLVDELKPAIESVPELSTFEITTGLAFLYFARQEVDIAVIEVGLGGRLDATNIVNPLISVITTLGYEHTALLGNTLTQIAGEKAGIIKPGRPVVLAPQVDEARLTVERIASERRSSLVVVGRDYLFQPGPHSLDGQWFQVWKPADSTQASLKIPLLGYHQLENAATAYAALDTARFHGLNIPQPALEEGFASVTWPGRFEVLQQDPALVIDSAHTRDAAHKLRVTLEDYFPGIPVVLVFGASDDKDIQGMFAELAGRVKLVIATRADHPRAIETQALLEIASAAGLEGRIVERVDGALEEALQEAGGEAMVLVAGSIFVTAEAREAWFGRQVS